MNPGNEFEFQSNVLPESSFNFFRDMRDKKEYCDVVLKTKDLTVPAHSIVIAAAIPYLRSALSKRELVNEVNIPEVDDLKPFAIESMIEYAYHGKIRSNSENVLDLLSAASRFQMDEMCNACCKFLAGNLTPENALSVREIGRQQGCEELVHIADGFIADNFDKMSEADDFLNCAFSVLSDIIKRDDLAVESEEKVYETVMRWIARSKERETHLAMLISNVRLALLKPSYLRLKVGKNELIRDSSVCRYWLDEITNHHMFPTEIPLSSEFNTQPRRLVRAEIQNDEGNESPHSPPFDESTENVNNPHGDDGEQDDQSAVEPQGQQQSSMHANQSAVEPQRQQQSSMHANQSAVKPHGKQQSSLHDNQNEARTDQASNLQFHVEGVTEEEDEPGGIYAVNAKLEFSIQHFNDRTKRWKVDTGNFFTINTASVTGLNQHICFLDCENMCYYNPINKEFSFTESYVQGRASAAVGNLLYIFGGSDSNLVFNTAKCFDSESEEWSDLKSMEMCREYAACVPMGNYIYVIGGNDFEWIHITVERYNIQNQEWDFAEPTLTGRSKHGAASLNGKIYVCGGITSLEEHTCADTAEVYDPNSDQWIPISPLSTARVNFTLLSYAGKLYAVGGFDEKGEVINDIDVYHPKTPQWRLGYPMAPELQITGAAVI